MSRGVAASAISMDLRILSRVFAVLIPSLSDEAFHLLQDSNYIVQVSLIKILRVAYTPPINPHLTLSALTEYMHMDWLTAVARKEPDR